MPYNLKGQNVIVFCPQRSKKQEFIQLVVKNAEYELARILKDQHKIELALDDLASS